MHARNFVGMPDPSEAASIAQRIVVKEGVITAYCERLAISRDELARRIGVARATAYRVDEGMVDPSPKFIAGLMLETGEPFEQLFRIVYEPEVATA